MDTQILTEPTRPNLKLNVLLILIWIATAIFSGLRFYNLSQKMYWGDEVASSLRVSGILSKDLSRKLLSQEGQIVSASDMQNYLYEPSPKGLSAVVDSLSTEDAQHPPLVPILQFAWAKAFGAMPGNLRFVSAVFGFLSILAVFFLCLEMFQSIQIASIAGFLLSISPIQLIYSQQTREYSAWTFIILITTLLFLRALRKNGIKDWVFYGISMAAALYTYITSGFVLGAFLIFTFTNKDVPKQKKIYFLTTSGLCLFAFLPWANVILNSVSGVVKNNNWSGSPVGFFDYVFMSILNLSRNLFDVNTWGIWDHPIEIKWTLVPVFIAAGFGILGIYGITKKNANKSATLLLMICACSFLPWFLASLIFGGRYGLVPRYFMPSLVAVSIGLALSISDLLDRNRWSNKLGILILVTIFSFGSISFTKYFSSRSWWTTRPPQLAQDLEDFPTSEKSSLILADLSSTFALLSVSFYVPKNTNFRVEKSFEQLSNEPLPESFILFRPTQALENSLSHIYTFKEIGSGKFLKIASKKSSL